MYPIPDTLSHLSIHVLFIALLKNNFPFWRHLFFGTHIMPSPASGVLRLLFSSLFYSAPFHFEYGTRFGIAYRTFFLGSCSSPHTSLDHIFSPTLQNAAHGTHPMTYKPCTQLRHRETWQIRHLPPPRKDPDFRRDGDGKGTIRQR